LVVQNFSNALRIEFISFMNPILIALPADQLTKTLGSRVGYRTLSLLQICNIIFCLTSK